MSPEILFQTHLALGYVAGNHLVQHGIYEEAYEQSGKMFKSDHYEDISLAQWIAHTPHQLVNQHLKVGGRMIDAIPREKIVNTPL